MEPDHRAGPVSGPPGRRPILVALGVVGQLLWEGAAVSIDNLEVNITSAVGAEGYSRSIGRPGGHAIKGPSVGYPQPLRGGKGVVVAKPTIATQTRLPSVFHRWGRLPGSRFQLSYRLRRIPSTKVVLPSSSAGTTFLFVAHSRLLYHRSEHLHDPRQSSFDGMRLTRGYPTNPRR